MWYTIVSLGLGNTESQVLASFGLLAHASLRRLVMSKSNNLLLLGAIAYGKPAGLLVASIDPASGTAVISSLYVAPQWRGRGIGSNLLRAFEGRCQQLGVLRLDFRYTREQRDPAIVNNFIAKTGWAPLKADWIVARGRLPEGLPEDPRVKLGQRFYKDVRPFPWSELTAEDRRGILLHAGAPNWQEEEMTPFVYEDRIEPLLSMGLRHQGEVVGWLVCHRMSVDVVRYTNLFIRQDMSPRGHSMRLLIWALCTQIEAGIPIATLQMRPDNAPMIKVIDRVIRPYLTHQYWVSRTSKHLAPR